MVIPSYYDAPDRPGKEHPDARRRPAARVDIWLHHAGGARVRADHPRRPIRRMTDAALARLSSPPTPPDDPKNPTVNFHGQQRRNDTHQSTTDPDARLYKKAVGREATLGYLAHLLTENRHGFAVDTAVTDAMGPAERDAAVMTLGELPLTTRRVTVGGDKNFNVPAWVAAVRQMGITPHVAQNTSERRSAIDGRTTRQPGYALSQCRRKKVEQPFGWMKTVELRHRGGVQPPALADAGRTAGVPTR